MARLRRTSPAQPGFSRRRRGSGWNYRAADGTPIADRAVRERIDALVIPPAWRDVWISAYANGHLQAVGTDEAGRRQYLYHPDWHQNQGKIKFDRALDLGRALPRARAQVAEDLASPSISRERVLATAFRLLDRGHFRIGSASYADRYGSYGLSTLRRDHVSRKGGVLTFSYVAKSGLDRLERIDDPLLLEAVGTLLRRRGRPDVEELLVYRDGRDWRHVTGSDINEYVKHVVRLEVSAKDFRTWHGTVLGAVAAAEEHRRQPPDRSWTKTAMNRAIRRAVVAVSENLGNTPAVCRASYIHPGVIEGLRDGQTIERSIARLHLPTDSTATDAEIDPEWINKAAAAPSVERAVIKLLAR